MVAAGALWSRNCSVSGRSWVQFQTTSCQRCYRYTIFSRCFLAECLAYMDNSGFSPLTNLVWNWPACHPEWTSESDCIYLARITCSSIDLKWITINHKVWSNLISRGLMVMSYTNRCQYLSDTGQMMALSCCHLYSSYQIAWKKHNTKSN